MFETLHRKLISFDFLLFLGDIVKTWRVFILRIVIGLVSVTAASAEEEHEVNSGTEVNFASDGKDHIVSPWTENFSDIEISNSSLRSTQYITHEQTKNHYMSARSGVDAGSGFELERYDSLTLTIYTPSGSSLGTYYDNSDGSVNGKDTSQYLPSQGYIEQGTWTFKVYGESVNGTQRYTFNVYQH